MNKIITIITLSLTFLSNTKAQETTEKIDNIKSSKLEYILKVKMGISELKINNVDIVNGTITQVDFLLSSCLSNKFRLEYGIGATEFKGNYFPHNDEYISINNNYLRLPLNVVYIEDFSSNASLITGLGFYGNYLQKSDIGNMFNGNNVGASIGFSFQAGARFKLNNDIGFGILLETQSDINKIKKQEVPISQILQKTTALSINFIYKF